MNNNNFFRKIYLSCTSASFYTKIINEPFIKSFVYLTFLVVLLNIPYSIFTGINYNKILNNVVTVVESDDFPSFALSQGKLEIYGDKPFIYSENTYNSLKMIIDNTGTYTFNDLAGYKMGFLINPDNLIISQAGMIPQVRNYNPSLKLSLSKEILINYINTSTPWLTYGSSILTLIFAYFSALFKTIIIYFIVSFFGKNTGLGFRPSQAYKLGMYSMTLPLIIIAILQFVPFIPSDFYFGIFIFTNLMVIIKIIKYFHTIKTNSSVL